MPRRTVHPGRLRRRLTIAFVLVAGISAGALALGSFLLVRDARLQDSLDRARTEARFDLLLSRGVDLSRPSAQARQFLQDYRSRGVNVVLLSGETRLASNPRVFPAIPEGLQALVAQGDLAYDRITQNGSHLLLVGGRQPGSTAQLYFVFPESSLFRDLRQLGTVLLVGWAIVLVVAGLVGRTLARRTLDPVARAAGAARDMAEGLLDTRLPVERADEFGSWALAFNRMADALEAKIRDLSEARAREQRFTSDVAHELRTPISALVGEASLLREHLDAMPPDARRPAELMVTDVGRLRRLVEELMEISRLDAGRESVRLEPVDLALAAVATIRARGWEGGVRVSGERVELVTDRRRLERILANLIGNALEHGRQNVRVRVGRDRAAANGLEAFVEVADDGPGIPSEHLPHVFERFYKADPARTSPGSGLGLAITLENARLLGGDVELWSEPGRGSRFTLRLPVTQPLPESESPVTADDHA